MRMDEKVAIAAYLRSLDLDFTEIAATMGTSSATAYRLVKRAEESGALTHHWRHELPDELLEAILPELEDHRVSEAIAGFHGLTNCVVVPTHRLSGLDRDSRRHEIVTATGRAAARLFARELAHWLRAKGADAVLAVSWGSTTAAAIDQIPLVPMDPLPDAFVVPAIGHVRSGASQDGLRSAPGSTSAELAGRLRRAIGATRAPLPLAVPAKLLDDTPDDHVRLAKESIFPADEGYDRLFGRGSGGADDALANRLDFLMMSLGGINGSALPDETREELRRHGVVGDILWRYVVRLGGAIHVPPTDTEDRSWVAARNRRIIGLEVEHIRALAERANRGAACGVLVIATGAEKAEIVRAALELGIINHLVVDGHLAGALLSPKR